MAEARTLADAYLEALQHLTALIAAVDAGQIHALAAAADAARVFLNNDEGFLVPLPSGQWVKV